MKLNMYRRIPAELREWFSEEEIARAKAYQRPLTVTRVISSLLSLALLLGVLSTHAAPRILDSLGVGAWPARLALTMLGLMIASTIVDLPIDIWQTFVHDRKWEFSTQTPGGFVADQLKGLLLTSVLFSALFIPLWALIRSTDSWWFWGWLVFLVFGVLLGFLYPVLIAPIFNKFTPLADEDLAARLRSLATSAGVTISDVLVMDASKRTKKDNAYFAGLGKTRRVVLFDNLLEQPREGVESVVAHELGHWRRRHIIRGVALGAVTSLLLFLLVRTVVTWRPALDFAGVPSIKDPAGLPLFLGAFAIGQMALGLVSSWFSRAYERQADIEALELTRNPDAFVEMMRGLQTKNLSEIAPSKLKYVRLSHPPAAERLALVRLWQGSQDPAAGGVATQA
ncbi:MAG TPA: M48 family metallopeptidase [Actinomycetota bacterium]|nr:M48 family metallopeptidase [Actinomycetota bacterium]